MELALAQSHMGIAARYVALSPDKANAERIFAEPPQPAHELYAFYHFFLTLPTAVAAIWRTSGGQCAPQYS